MAHDTHVSLLKERPSRRIFIILCLTAGYMVAEIIGGLMSNSLALLADAGHMLADVAALIVSLVAFYISARPANDKASFGYFRAEVLGALFNGVVLLAISIFIISESVQRIFNPEPVETNTMIIVAIGGLLVNIVGLMLLHKDKACNINIRGAWLHVFSDMLGSIGVIISGILIHFFGWSVDPIASILIAGLITYSSINLIIDTVRVLMEHVPAHIDPHEVIASIEAIAGKKRVHDLHIWSITPGQEALAVHVVVDKVNDYNTMLHAIQKTIADKFAILHTTIQLEDECNAIEYSSTHQNLP